MKKRIIHLAALSLTALMVTASAPAVTVTVVDDGVSNIGAPGTFYWAITNTPAGGTIDFAIPGDGPHYLQIPPGGFPIIYRQGNLTIDGFTQGSATGTTTDDAKANTNPLTAANNAVMKIVIDGRTGNHTRMEIKLFGTTLTTVPPIDNSYMIGTGEASGLTGEGEAGLLGVYRSTNVNIRGLAFLGKASTAASQRSKGIVIEMDYDGVTDVLPRYGYSSGSSDGCHVNGCWFGVNPTNPTVAGSADQAFRVSVTSYRHTDGPTLGRPQLILGDLTVGVAKGSLNPRAEFNVMAGVGGFLSLDALGLRVSGNFISVLPDGTPFNFIADSLLASQFRGGWFDVGCRQDDELGRPMVIGTDGDGVNDADEGNLFGPLARNPSNQSQFSLWGFFETRRNAFICAGNRIGVAYDGTVWPNNDCFISTFRMDQATQVRFGSDFNGVSDALEANVIYDNNIFATQYPTPAASLAKSLFRVMDNIAAPDGWFSFRGNSQVNNFPNYNPDDLTADDYYNTWNTYSAVADNRVPVLLPSTVSTLNGTFNAPTINGANICIVDVYLPDPEGQVNGAAFNYAFFGGVAGEGFVQGKTHLGSFLDNGPYDSDPAVGAFSFNIAGLALAPGTKVTVAVTFSKWTLPVLATPIVGGGNVTLSWTGDNGGPYTGGLPGPSSGFGVQSASSISGPWTTTFAPGNTITLPAAGSTGFYRIVAPISGMTTLCAIPVTLP